MYKAIERRREPLGRWLYSVACCHLVRAMLYHKHANPGFSTVQLLGRWRESKREGMHDVLHQQPEELHTQYRRQTERIQESASPFFKSSNVGIDGSREKGLGGERRE